MTESNVSFEQLTPANIRSIAFTDATSTSTLKILVRSLAEERQGLIRDLVIGDLPTSALRYDCLHTKNAPERTLSVNETAFKSANMEDVTHDNLVCIIEIGAGHAGGLDIKNKICVVRLPDCGPVDVCADHGVLCLVLRLFVVGLCVGVAG